MAGHNIPIASQSSNRFAIMSSPRSLKFLIWTPMIIVTVIALSVSYHHASPSLAFLRVGCHPSSHEHKHTGHGEETVVTHFQHLREMEDFGEAGDRIWHSQLLPSKGGFLWVETNSTEDIVGAEGWGVTMFHALHCLQMIREVFKSTMSPEHAFSHAMPGHPPAHHDPKHATHCLAYLYQVITCGGDGTIEPPQRRYDAQGRTIEWVVNGAGLHHQCRNTKPLWDAVLASEKKSFELMDWRMGDTVWNTFK